MIKINHLNQIRLSLLATLLIGLTSMAFEEPQYSVTSKLNKIEIRQYQAYLVAETEVVGDRESAGSAGFKVLAGYIFGNNQGDHNISMTAPVIQAEQNAFMTQTPSPEISKTTENRVWTVQFMMPTQYTLESLPVPKDPRVKFKTITSRKVAAVTYSGRWTESNYREHLEILEQEIQKAGLKPKGQPLWARYNSPFTPWFLRKNEILIEIE